MRAISTYCFFLLALCIIPVFLFAGSTFGSNNTFSDNTFSDKMLPEGLIMKNIYKPGIGSPVGKVVLVQGKAVIIHSNILSGYFAKKDFLLFKGDTIITLPKGRIRFKLNDGSILTQASNTRLVISRSIYDSTKKSRSSFFNMTLGKTRFWVTKMFGFKYSEFRVKTQTAIAGVRGSDFIVRATPNLTEVTALENTSMEVVSLAAPEVMPTLLADFERTMVEEGALPSEAEMVLPEEIEEIKKEFTVIPDGIEWGEKADKRKGKAEKTEAKEDESENGEVEEKRDAEESVYGQEKTENGVIEEKAFEEEGRVEEPAIIVSVDELVEPEYPEPEEFEKFTTPDIVMEAIGQEEFVSLKEDVVEIVEKQHEELSELPGFPGTP